MVLVSSLVICSLFRRYFVKSQRHKILILGSAPYMQKWVSDHLQWFKNNHYSIVTFNNSWKLVPDPSDLIWHSSLDHSDKGTYVPSREETRQFKRYHIHSDDDESVRLYYQKKSTMFFNVLYHYIYDSYLKKYPLHVVVVGCDMIYKKEQDTFYSHTRESKAKNDPINRLGVQNLNNESNHSLNLCRSQHVDIYNASMYESRLPYPRFRIHLT